MPPGLGFSPKWGLKVDPLLLPRHSPLQRGNVSVGVWAATEECVWTSAHQPRTPQSVRHASPTLTRGLHSHRFVTT